MNKVTILIFYFMMISNVFSDVNFKAQTIKGTIAEAKHQQKLIMSVCSAESCRFCRWMDQFVYSDTQLSRKINENFISIKPQFNMDQLEFMENCQSLPSILFVNENGEIIHKEKGKKTLAEMEAIVQKVMSSNCTDSEQVLDPTIGTFRANNCCEGLVPDKDQKCVKRQCVEQSERGIYFDGDPRQALNCCDDNLERRVIFTIKGHLVHCMDQETFKKINNRRRYELKDGEFDVLTTPAPDIVSEPEIQKQ